jgi:protein involved in polysaccharide export with SLBB domain/Flp pilus assembly protein TadD
MKKVLSPIILLAALSPLCPAFAQTETGSQGPGGTGRTAPASSKKSGSDKQLKAQETAAANNPTGQSPTRDGTEKAVGADATRTANDNRSSEDKAADARKFYESGVALFESGRLDDAVELLKQAVKLDPGNAPAQYSLGIAYAKSNKYEEAADSFKRAARLKTDWAEAHFRLGWMYYVLDKRSQALEEHKKLVNLKSPLANTLWRIIRTDSPSAEVAVSDASVENQPSSRKDEPKREESGSGSTSKKERVKTKKSDAASDRVPAAATENQSTVSSVPSPGSTTNGSLTNGNGTSAPASSPAPSVSVTGNNSTSASADEAALVNIYRVGVGDVLDIRLLNSTTNRSTLYTVMDGGLIEFPLVGGSMAVAGLTTDEIQARLGAELKRRAVQEGAPLSVGVRQYASHTAIITGLVGIPGTKILRRETVPLFVILAEAQPRLDAARATIMRGGGPAATVDLSDAAALNFLVHPGDVINLTSRPQDFYYIAGRINNPGQKNFQSGITLMQAILAAGGPVRQSEKTVDLSREGADGRLSTTRYNLKEIKSGKVQDPRLQPGDRIEVVH